MEFVEPSQKARSSNLGKIYYYQTGEVWYKENYSNGKLKGVKEVYYPNQKPFSTEHYKDGMLHGEKLVYDENGKVKLKENYDCNQLARKNKEDKNGK